MVKNLPAMQETQETIARSLGQEDPQEEEEANHSSHSSLGKPMDRGVWWDTVQRVAKGSDMTEHESMTFCSGSLAD